MKGQIKVFQKWLSFWSYVVWFHIIHPLSWKEMKVVKTTCEFKGRP